MTLEELASLAQLPVSIAALAVLVWFMVKLLAFIRSEHDAFIAQLTVQREQYLGSQERRDDRFIASIDANTEATRELRSTMRTWHELAASGRLG